MKGKTKIILIILVLIVLVYLLFPKNIGFIEKQNINGQEIILGEYSECLGIKLSKEVGNKTFFKCIGIPFGKKTI